MITTKRALLGCLLLIGLLVAGGTLVALNWDTVSEVWLAQTERTEVTLFRLGEAMSIGAALKAKYGVEPGVTYNTGDNGRILSLVFTDDALPDETMAEGHAREIAAFAAGSTTKASQIDVVKVLFQTSAGDDSATAANRRGPYSFTPGELLPARPQADPAADDDPAGT